MTVACMMLSSAVTLCAETPPATHSTWMLNVNWERFNGEPPGHHSGYATVLRFERDGRFRKIDGLALRTRAGVTLSNGDGLRFSDGHWTVDNNVIAVQYRVVQRIPDLSSEPLPG